MIIELDFLIGNKDLLSYKSKLSGDDSPSLYVERVSQLALRRGERSSFGLITSWQLKISKL
jgi:hypothetical protein